jgi:DNA-binding SARP family transcriptional activator
VQINPKADLWLDVAAFEETYNQTHGVPAQALNHQQFQNLHCAVGLYREELLGGWYQEWCLCERERFRYMYLAMLDKLINSCELRRDYEAGIAYGMRVLRCDPAQERAHRQLMRLHYLAGDRTAALRQYERCLVALREELDVPPAQATEDLCKQIRADQLDELSSPLLDNQARLISTAYTPMFIIQIKQFQSDLATIQRWTQQHIEAIERTLHTQHQV